MVTFADDPFADLPFDVASAEPLDQSITEGATVVDISRHPIYGSMYRCRGWFAIYPWMLTRRDAVVAYRGDRLDSPKVGEAGIVQLRRNNTDVKQIAVGTEDGEVMFDLVLDVAVSIDAGDTLTFRH